MKKNTINSLLSNLFFLFLFSKIIFAQTGVSGQIYSKDEADRLFGPSFQFVKMPVANFEKLLDQCADKMMFRFEGTNLYILNGSRTTLFSTSDYSKKFSLADTVKYYSKSVIKELLTKGQSSYVIIENRADVMSVTVGEYTMEKATVCPPDCPIDPLQ